MGSFAFIPPSLGARVPHVTPVRGSYADRVLTCAVVATRFCSRRTIHLATFSIHPKNLIPVQLIGTDRQGTDHVLGDFEGGVVLKGLDLQDVLTSTIVASFSIRRRLWVVKGVSYPYLFVQVKPVD